MARATGSRKVGPETPARPHRKPQRALEPVARATPSRRAQARKKVACFCAAPWPVFAPPLTAGYASPSHAVAVQTLRIMANQWDRPSCRHSLLSAQAQCLALMAARAFKEASVASTLKRKLGEQVPASVFI